MFVSPGNVSQKIIEAGELIDLSNGFPRVAGVGITAGYIDGKIQVDTKTKFFDMLQSDIYVGVYLVKDHVIWDQSGKSDNADHRYLLRDHGTDDVFGKLIASGGVDLTLDYMVSTSFDITDPENLGDYSVVAIVWNKQGSKYTFLNGYVEDDITEIISSVANPLSDAISSVSYQSSEDRLNIRLRFSHDPGMVNYHVYSMDGKTLSQGSLGSLTVSDYQFQLDIPRDVRKITSRFASRQ